MGVEVRMLDDYSTAMSRPQDPWQTRVDTHREFLKHNLYVDDQLLHSLMRRRLKSGGAFLLTRADKENVESNTGSTTNMTAPTNSTKVNTLVEILRFKGPKEETFELLCHSLYEIKRVWIVQELMGHSDESQDPWQTRVDTHREFLKHNLHVDDELLNSLMGKRLESGASLLTQIDKEDNIESSALTNLAKVDALVKVLRFKGPKEETFNLLCLSLYDVRRVWIVQELMGWEQSHSDESDSKQGALEGKSTSMEPGVKGWKDRLTNDTQSSKQVNDRLFFWGSQCFAQVLVLRITAKQPWRIHVAPLSRIN